MSGMNHTPEPWVHRPAARGCMEQVYSTHGNGCLVATCDPACTADAANNARFITSGPKLERDRDALLAACKEWMRAIKAFREVIPTEAFAAITVLCDTELTRAQSMSKAAIAKATGVPSDA